MLKIDRHSYIEQELMIKGSIQISALSEALQCSEETIRRDLKELEAAGKLTRTQGGAYLMDRYDKSYPSKLRKDFFRDKKADMAHIALKYIKESDVIMLDSSTTCLALAEALIFSKRNVTIITNSLLVCELCSERATNINLISLGGTFRQRTASFVGPHTLATLHGYYADHAFISCPYITLEHGLSDHKLDEAQVRADMLHHSREKILLMDHTKFTSNGNILFGNLPAIDVLITDQVLPESWEDYCRQNNILLEYTDTRFNTQQTQHIQY